MKIFFNKNFFVIIISYILIIIVSLYFFTKDTRQVTVNTNDFYFDNSTEEVKISQIAIHITGEINSPGILYLDTNSRICDAINKAGGVTANADLNMVNLAYELNDGQKIYIPSIYDENKIDYIDNTAGENVLDDSTQEKNKVININSATQSELESLPGIGESTANKIIDYRNKNGKFKTIEDLKNISRHW